MTKGRRNGGRATLAPRHVALALVCAVTGAGCAGGLATPNGDLFPEPPRNAVTFWGHACVYIDVEGEGIVTDPVFNRTVLLRHRRIDAPPPASYAGTKLVLISHAHPDHLSASTLQTFPDSAVILCPEPSSKYLRDAGPTVRVMHPGDTYEMGATRVTAVAVHHMGSRYGVSAAADGRALGYVIETPGTTIFYSGDTNYFSGFDDVGWTFAPDVAILNVNGHMASTDATRAAWATRAPAVIPIHWGAFGYWVFGGNKRPRDEVTLRHVIGDRLLVLEVGQSLPLATATYGGASSP